MMPKHALIRVMNYAQGICIINDYNKVHKNQSEELSTIKCSMLIHLFLMVHLGVPLTWMQC